MEEPFLGFFVLLFAAGIGIFLIILRNRGFNPYVIDSLELLILIMIPVTGSMQFFSEPKEILYWWLGVYFAGLIGWALVSLFVISKSAADDNWKSQNNFVTAACWGAGIFIGILAYWVFSQIIPIFQQANLT